MHINCLCFNVNTFGIPMCAQLSITYNLREGPEDDWITVETCSPVVISKNKCCADVKTDLFTERFCRSVVHWCKYRIHEDWSKTLPSPLSLSHTQARVHACTYTRVHMRTCPHVPSHACIRVNPAKTSTKKLCRKNTETYKSSPLLGHKTPTIGN